MMDSKEASKLKETIVSLVQERRALKEREDYLTSEWWQDLKNEIENLKKELQETHGRIAANDTQLCELIDLLNDEMDLDDGNMYG